MPNLVFGFRSTSFEAARSLGLLDKVSSSRPSFRERCTECRRRKVAKTKRNSRANHRSRLSSPLIKPSIIPAMTSSCSLRAIDAGSLTKARRHAISRSGTAARGESERPRGCVRDLGPRHLLRPFWLTFGIRNQPGPGPVGQQTARERRVRQAWQCPLWSLSSTGSLRENVETLDVRLPTVSLKTRNEVCHHRFYSCSKTGSCTH
jgi:hypothetical protein